VKKEIGNYEIRVVLNGSRDFYQNGIEKENIIISAGRLLEGKGFQFLIKAFNELNKNNWKLYVIGDGPYKSKLIELAQGNANTVFTGWLDNTGDEYRLLLNKAKIFSLLSSRESQGVVFLEAMSAKCAILSSNITACRETVTEDIGFLVNGKNIEEIKEKLNEMMMGEDRLKEFMNNARKRYEEKYTYPEIVSQYINLL
jgi:GalNAc-alpha-(1->4)-GalNAc-alpha-(1->3)-diNAcBac-PP-undecaprenol alpha-1,4-N-acetyl-D-galactosaminyltransferase